MADKVSTSDVLKTDMLFVDGDTRSFNIPNPNTSIDLQQGVADLNALIQANNLIIGDRYGGAFAKITKATRIRKQTTDLDLS